MEPNEALQRLESVWQRQPITENHDDTPITRDHLADRGFASVDERPDSYRADCPVCGGTGDHPQYGPAHRCGKCQGTGKVWEADA